MQPMFWAWVTVAVTLAICEGATGGLFVLPWAIGAAGAAGLNALGVETGWQWGAFAAISSILMVAIQRFIGRRRR